MNKLFSYFVRKSEPEAQMTCLSSSGPTAIIDYSAKADRSEAITYDTTGKIKYGTGIPPAIYDTSLQAIKAFPIVAGCVTARSDAAASMSIKVFDVKGGMEAEVPDHDFYRVYSNPNPYQGTVEFMELISQYLDVTGNCFIAIEKGKGIPVELYVLPTKNISIIPDPKIKVKEYRYYVNGQSIPYKPEEIIHIKVSDLDDPYFGAPPLSSATDILTFENYRIQFSNRFFKNGAIPVGILETEQVLGDSLLKKLRGEWTNIHGGINNAHKIAILQGGLKYNSISSPIKELDLANLKRLSKEDIQLIYKVPDSVLGNLEGTSGSEGRDALTAFWRTAMIPHLTRIESALNRGLKKALFGDGKQVMRFNFKAVAALQDDKESVATYLSALLSASVMTPNEARAVVGLPKSTDPNADKLFISNSNFGNQLIPADQANNPQANNAEKPTTKPGKPAQAAVAKKPGKGK